MLDLTQIDLQTARPEEIAQRIKDLTELSTLFPDFSDPDFVDPEVPSILEPMSLEEYNAVARNIYKTQRNLEKATRKMGIPSQLGIKKPSFSKADWVELFNQFK